MLPVKLKRVISVWNMWSDKELWRKSSYFLCKKLQGLNPIAGDYLQSLETANEQFRTTCTSWLDFHLRQQCRTIAVSVSDRTYSLQNHSSEQGLRCAIENVLLYKPNAHFLQMFDAVYFCLMFNVGNTCSLLVIIWVWDFSMEWKCFYLFV